MLSNLTPLTLGSIQPRGWLLAQLRRDLVDGFASRLDLLTEHARNDLFQNRIESSTQQFAWWDSETRGNWLWGYTLMAHLSGLPDHIARVTGLMEALKNTQDPDGYIGIYSPASRYQHGSDENGELWAQSRALLALLTHYEFTQDETYLNYVCRAVDLTLQHYGPHASYFRRPAVPNDLTGMTHGLCYVDVVERLFHLIGDTRYRDFGVWLWDDFARFDVPFPNDDLAPENLRNPHFAFHGHAVHTVEHLRPLLFGTSDRALVEAALRKLRLYATPSGAVIGDEGIHGLATPDIGYEYCTLTELLYSLTKFMQKYGDPAMGDWVETLAFNAAQGARFSDGTCISYLTSDTRLRATSAHPDSYSHLHGKHGRFKFSPTHEDVACCCNPNATRLLPHYINHMWMKTGDGLAAMLYGACEVTATIHDSRVTIAQQTQYPFEEVIRFSVSTDGPVRFTLYLRKPQWATTVSCTGVTARDEGDYLIIEKTWVTGDAFVLAFTAPIRLDAYPTGEYAVKRGALQYALLIAHTARAIKDYPLTGFHDYDLVPQDIEAAYQPVFLEAVQPDYGLSLVRTSAINADDPWASPPIALRVNDAVLVPFGCTTLRRAAFPLKAE